MIGGPALGNGLAIDSRVIRYSETLAPEWNGSATLTENPEILAPQWAWSSAIREASGYPKTGKIHTVRSTVKLVVSSND
jgi:hypothetical protein